MHRKTDMPTSRISNITTLSSSIHEHRQIQARIRALQKKTNAVSEELSYSSAIAETAVYDIEQAYIAITKEFREQRDQLFQRLDDVKQNIKQSNKELDGIRKDLDTTRSFRLPQNSPRHSIDLETQEMNAMMNDIERVLNKIAQQLQQVRFIPSNSRTVGKTLGNIRVKDNHRKETKLPLPISDLNEYHPTYNLSVHKLYTVDIDISARWIVSSINKRIFLCDHEGEIRIYSYSRQFHRQPIITERFHLAIIRLISAFTVTQDYLIAFETDTQILTLHTHHGSLLLRLVFPYDPLMIIRCNYHQQKNQIWTCSRSQRHCYQFHLNHTSKEVYLLDQLDFTRPISNVPIEPVGISTDEQDRIAVHDMNAAARDRLLLFTNSQNIVIPLDFIKHDDKRLSSSIERVLLVPKFPHLIVLIYTPQPSTANLREIVVVDISSQPAQILHCLSEINGIECIDITLNGELVYTVTAPANKRIPSKMHIYSLIN